nr:cytochrome c [Poseidonocella sp. HB161398]
MLRPEPPALPASGRPAPGEPIVEIDLPADLSATARTGKQAFDAVCASCHGENAVGRQGSGPPLVHVIYEPGHHADMAFQMAAARGVRAHHWRFGDMPPQPAVTRGDVTAIIAYIRELQRANGID